MSQILSLKEPEVHTGEWRQTILWPLNKTAPIRGVDYDTFVKFYQLCPVWAIRYKNRKVNRLWDKMNHGHTCVMGEFNGWNGGWGEHCKTCKNFGFSGGQGKPGFYRGSDYAWRKTIPAFVRHIEQCHPERLQMEPSK